MDLAHVEQTQAALRAARDKANPPKPEPVRVEYNRLRKQLFDLQQHAKNMEIYCNEQAGKVKLFEQRITDLLKQKKAVADNPLHERFCEHQIQTLETELLDAKTEFNRAKNQNSNAARGLRAFDGHARIAELKKELGL